MHFTVEIFEGKSKRILKSWCIFILFYFILAGGICAVSMIHIDFTFMKAVLWNKKNNKIPSPVLKFQYNTSQLYFVLLFMVQEFNCIEANVSYNSNTN